MLINVAETVVTDALRGMARRTPSWWWMPRTG